MDPLLKLVEEEGIFLTYRDLSKCSRPIYGLYFYDERRKQPFIVLDKTLREGSAMFRSVLAEELGHHFTVPQSSVIVPYTSYSYKLQLSRDERRALQWACDFLMPDSEFVKSLASAESVESIAEIFNVTPWLVRWKVQFLRRG